MKKLYTMAWCWCIALTALAVDVTLVNNQPMQDASAQKGSGWYKYTLSSLKEGTAINVMFNNGGWEGGQTSGYYVDDVENNLCFTSNGSEITQINCNDVPTDIEDNVADAPLLYSKEGCIVGYYVGTVAVYTLSGKSVATTTADGYFTVGSFTPGLYVVQLGDKAYKIVV